jgi:hypothetical protein
MKTALAVSCTALLLAASSNLLQAQLIWQVGKDDNGWPAGDGGGPNTSFVQENGSIQPLPGNPNSPEVDTQADNDYYFAGLFTMTIPSAVAFYGDYTPVGAVAANEEAAERAFAAADNDLRYHFNLPDTLQPTDLLSITFDALNLDTGHEDSRYGVEVYFNGVLVQTQIVIRPAQTGKAYTTPQFSLSSVNAQVGPGYDNIVSLKGINYSTDGGGNWMGVDYVQLNPPGPAIPAPVFPWAVGKDDNDWPVGDGGGPNATFVQENGSINALPGSPNSPEINQQADNDYYFAGNYTSIIAANGTYVPVGLVSSNEEAAERAFAGADNDQRYHFNLPNTMAPQDLVQVSFDALNLDTDNGTDPRYGVEVYFNNVLVQPEIVIRPGQLGHTFATPPFTLGSVNAEVGSGFDNIVTLRGINHSAEGGGNWMGIDYIQLNPATQAIPPPVLPWSVGMDDNDWPLGDGGGPNTSFVEPDGVLNPLPGSPTSPEFDRQADNDYYFAGSYSTTIPGNGTYVPVGLVPANEEAAERGFTGADNQLRYHFNLPATLSTDDVLSITYDTMELGTGADARYGIEVYFNGVLVQTQIVIRAAQLNTPITTPSFTLGSVNAQMGSGFDNIITLKGTSYGSSGGSDSLGIDFISVKAHPRVSFPWQVGKDDNDWPAGNGGGPNTTFVQENGTINPLPGVPNSPEVNQQGDNDYYFAGEYTSTIPSVVSYYGADYTPVGVVLVNEESAERAFAGNDNDLRYHFNLPPTVQPSDLLAVTYDALNLDTGHADSRYGIEVYFNGVLVQTQIVIRPAQLGVTYTTPQFSLASVNGAVGPGFDNIVSLKGISYSNDGGGAWMGIDYVKLDRVPLKLLPSVISGNQITISWTGIGLLESAPSINGPWTAVDGALDSPWTEDLVAGQNRYYRLVQ